MHLGIIAYSESPGAEIEGVVLCSQTRQALEYATISLMAQKDSSLVAHAITDAKGFFCIKNVPEGEYYLVLQFMGYEKKYINGVTIDQKTRQVDLGRIEMQISVQDLSEFEVTNDKNALAFGIDRKVIDVSKELSAVGGTAVDALQNVPSVQVDAYGNVLLRGSADFTLLINGKPTLQEASQVLQQTQAETIESIEIITNPSVKYEAKGTTGIINLKLKKQYKDKTEGLVNLSLANGDKYSGSLMLNRQFNKFSTFMAVSYSNKTQRTTNWGYHDLFGADSSWHESIDSKRKIKRLSADVKVGADYNFNDNNSLSFSAQIGDWQFNRDISSFYQQINEISMDTTLSQDTEEHFSLENKFVSGDISFSHLFKNKDGHKLDLVAFYGGLNNNTVDDFEAGENTLIQQIENNSGRNQFRFSADYSLPLKYDISFEAGLFSDIQRSDYDYSITGDVPVGDASGSIPQEEATFDYSNAVYAAYSVVSKEIKDWFNFQAGVRAELYEYSTESPEPGLNNSSSAFNLFPSVHLSKELNDKHRLGLSYSRRVNRPDEWQLCPVIYSSDIYETKMGNPDLLQSLTDSYEFSYLLMIGKIQMNAELYYRYTHDPIGSYILNVDDQIVETYDNLEKEINSGIEWMGAYKPYDWLNFRLTANAYHSQWSGKLMDGNELDGNSLLWNGSFTSTFILKKNTSLQFLAIYYAPGEIPQGKADAFYYFDFILKHSFFNKKLTLGLRTHNTFDTGLYHYTASGEDYYTENWYRYEGPVFIFTLSYKLNNFRQKQSDQSVRMDFDSGLDH